MDHVDGQREADNVKLLAVNVQYGCLEVISTKQLEAW